MHARAIRALKVVIVDDGDLGFVSAADRPRLYVNLRHQVLGDIDLVQAGQDLPVLAEQEIEACALGATCESNHHVIEPGNLSRLGIGKVDLYLWRDAVARPDLGAYAMDSF